MAKPFYSRSIPGLAQETQKRIMKQAHSVLEQAFEDERAAQRKAKRKAERKTRKANRRKGVAS